MIIMVCVCLCFPIHFDSDLIHCFMVSLSWLPLINMWWVFAHSCMMNPIAMQILLNFSAVVVGLYFLFVLNNCKYVSTDLRSCLKVITPCSYSCIKGL